jgi:uncharacterized protein YcbK (DUF882 family)
MFKYFKIEDFDCQETGENKMDIGFIKKLDLLRAACGFPFHITSGYRSPDHSIEAKKVTPGTHAQGIAADIYARNGAERYQIQKHAYALGFTGIGQHNTFIHVDIRDTTPVAWPY